jgi:hypothetical protein
MRITDEHLARFRRDGFVLVENFLTEEERKAALNGFHRWFAPSYEEWLAAGKRNTRPQQKVFPWDDSGLNHAMTHPDLIDAAERLIGTREIRLSEAHLGVKYYEMDNPPGTPPGAFHRDYGNNTLGPLIDPDDYQHIFFFYYFEDVRPGMAPIQMVPNGKTEADAVPIHAPGGSVCIYTPYTVHASSEFQVPGYRAVAWVGFTRKDRPWDGARAFTYKNGADPNGMRRFIAEASPRQLELIGFPPPGDPLWTDAFLDGMAKRYPGFDPARYRVR